MEYNIKLKKKTFITKYQQFDIENIFENNEFYPCTPDPTQDFSNK